jgi:hypothetical protein
MEVGVMKSFVFSVTLVLSILIACSAQAQTLTKYDDFNGPLLDQTKWVVVNDGGDDVESLEGGMKIQKGKLIFFNRAFGGIGSNTGMQFMQRELVIKEGSAYDTMETSVQIMSYQITGCAANSLGSIASVRIGGYFFNDGTSSGEGDLTGNYFAYINLYRYSNSNDDDGLWRATAKVYRCEDAACTSSLASLIGDDFFSNQQIKVKKKVRLFIQLNKTTNQFNFQVGSAKKGPQASIGYSADDTNGPRGDYGGLKRIEVSHGLANCTAGPTTGWIDAVFDYVAVGP